jgi:hypothetical protein
MDHRWGRRIDCGASVGIAGPAGLRGAGRMRDVSMSGALVETELPLPVHAAVEIEMVRAHGPGARLAGIVVRSDADGVGIEWREASHGAICPVLGCATPCEAAARWD